MNLQIAFSTRSKVQINKDLRSLSGVDFYILVYSVCRVFDLLFYMSLYVLHMKLILTVFRASRGHGSATKSKPDPPSKSR